MLISSSRTLLHRPFFFTGIGSISAILLRQSDSVSCGPETKVPLTLVEYQPDSTPRRSASSVLTCRGERFCIGCFRLDDRDRVERRKGFKSCGDSSRSALRTKPRDLK